MRARVGSQRPETGEKTQTGELQETGEKGQRYVIACGSLRHPQLEA